MLLLRGLKVSLVMSGSYFLSCLDLNCDACARTLIVDTSKTGYWELANLSYRGAHSRELLA